jgi:hypothetical protein
LVVVSRTTHTNNIHNTVTNGYSSIDKWVRLWRVIHKPTILKVQSNCKISNHWPHLHSSLHTTSLGVFASSQHSVRPWQMHIRSVLLGGLRSGVCFVGNLLFLHHVLWVLELLNWTVISREGLICMVMCVHVCTPKWNSAMQFFDDLLSHLVFPPVVI